MAHAAKLPDGHASHGTQISADWCEDICINGSLAASIAATNHAMEGPIGEWSQRVYGSTRYVESLATNECVGSLRWLQLHAAYARIHPWEALEIVCTLKGAASRSHEVTYLTDCIKLSYTTMRLSMDRCMRAGHALEAQSGTFA